VKTFCISRFLIIWQKQNQQFKNNLPFVGFRCCELPSEEFELTTEIGVVQVEILFYFDIALVELERLVIIIKFRE